MKAQSIISAASILLAAISFNVHAASISIVPPSPTGPIVNDGNYASPQGDYAAYTNTQNIALGASVSVSGTIANYPTIHNSDFITDGNYGNGRSWIGTGANSWLTIDLGSVQSFSTLSFGRDRVTAFDDRDPGQFSILTSNDGFTFGSIFDSSTLGFSGNLSAGQTVQATFDTATARYVKLELTNGGAAIDEVEIMSPVPLPAAAWLFGSALLGLGVIKRKKA